MTKEEVAQVIANCDENKISYRQRLSELGISPWNFYDAKRKYAPKEEGENAGEFLQLIPGGSFLPNPIRPSRSRSSKQGERICTRNRCGEHRAQNNNRNNAAVRAAIVYSLVDSCKALDVNSREWMEHVLYRIPGNENNREALRELLPDNWAKQTNQNKLDTT